MPVSEQTFLQLALEEPDQRELYSFIPDVFVIPVPIALRGVSIDLDTLFD